MQQNLSDHDSARYSDSVPLHNDSESTKRIRVEGEGVKDVNIYDKRVDTGFHRFNQKSQFESKELKLEHITGVAVTFFAKNVRYQIKSNLISIFICSKCTYLHQKLLSIHAFNYELPYQTLSTKSVKC